MKMRIITINNNFYSPDKQGQVITAEHKPDKYNSYSLFGYFDGMGVTDPEELNVNDHEAAMSLWGEISKHVVDTLDGSLSRSFITVFTDDHEKDENFWSDEISRKI